MDNFIAILSILYVITTVMYVYWLNKRYNNALNELNRLKEWQEYTRNRVHNILDVSNVVSIRK